MLSVLNVAETYLNAGLVFLMLERYCGEISFSNNFYQVAFTALLLTLAVGAPGVELILIISTDIHAIKKKICVFRFLSPDLLAVNVIWIS